MERTRVVLVLGILAIIVLGAFSLEFNSNPSNSDGLQNGSETVNATFSNGNWAVLEVADNSSERRKGLMNRETLPNNRGMLFVFEDEDERVFWMKNTLIPLDIIYLDAKKSIVDIDTAYPEPNTSESDLERYPSDQPAKYVIEVNAGFAENNSIKEGNKVKWD